MELLFETNRCSLFRSYLLFVPIVLLFLMSVSIGQALFIWALLNRLLVAKGITPVTVPEMTREDLPVAKEERRKLFTVRVAD